MILGIDQSLSKTALVLQKNGKVIDFKLIKTDVKDLTDRRIHKIGQEIIKFILKNKVDYVNIENLPYSCSSRSVRPLAGLYYYLSILFYENNIKSFSIEPTKLKKFATNKGNAKKEEMIEALPEDVRNLFNIYLNNKKLGLDDLADAYFLSIFK